MSFFIYKNARQSSFLVITCKMLHILFYVCCYRRDKAQRFGMSVMVCTETIASMMVEIFPE